MTSGSHFTTEDTENTENESGGKNPLNIVVERLSVHHSLDSVPEARYVKIDEQADTMAAQLEV